MQLFPPFFIEIVNRVVFLACKAKQPISCSVCWNVRLIYAADWKRIYDSFVTSLHSISVMLIKRTSLLIYHDSIITKSIITNSIKFSCEISL